ncbi:MAG: hypothetical protein J07HX64_02503 [halophilic archaeon J07HX64]|jgi:hypothetical protein|nr:MAG: hypothetical protein J07HX64_02503 [halophilic archaeon J07HX64]
MDLTDREYAVVTSVWGEETPQDLDQVEQELLVAMHDRISQAVQTAYTDSDEDSLAVLLPLERKIIEVLRDRL